MIHLTKSLGFTCDMLLTCLFFFFFFKSILLLDHRAYLWGKKVHTLSRDTAPH